MSTKFAEAIAVEENQMDDFINSRRDENYALIHKVDKPNEFQYLNLDEANAQEQKVEIMDEAKRKEVREAMKFFVKAIAEADGISEDEVTPEYCKIRCEKEEQTLQSALKLGDYSAFSL